MWNDFAVGIGMSWIIYKGRERENFPMRPYVSIAPDGQIAINSVVTEYIVGWKYAELWYEDDRNVLGIKLVHEKTHDGIRAITPRKKNRVISCYGFLLDNEIDLEKTTKFHAKWVPEKRFILVYLDQPVPSRAKTKSPSST